MAPIVMSVNGARDHHEWSTDGTLIAYWNRDFDRFPVGQQIATMNVDGTAVLLLYDIELDPRLSESTDLFRSVSLPQWAPDGEVVAFVVESLSIEGIVEDMPSESTGEIYAIHRDGTGLTNLTNDPARDGLTLGHDRRGFSWSPDGARIAFISDRDGTDDLYVMDADGSDVRQLTYGCAAECCGFGWLMDSPLWSPSK
jgi:TolB protein